jgi:hypothetical protein
MGEIRTLNFFGIKCDSTSNYSIAFCELIFSNGVNITQDGMNALVNPLSVVTLITIQAAGVI